MRPPRPRSPARPWALAAGAVLVVAIALLATARSASAKTFAITSLATTATLQPDASMDVQEQVTYDFQGGPFTVGIRSFDAASLDQIQGFTAKDEAGNELAVTPPDQSISGEWEWAFDPTSDATRTFTLHYTVTDAAEVGPDVGELYWKFLGSDHPGVGDVRVQVSLPGSYPPATPATPPTDTSVVRAWAHGPSNGVVANTGSQVTLAVKDVPAEQFVEARILVPSAAFTAPAAGPPRLPTVLKQEQNFINDREAKDRRIRIGNISAPALALLGAGGFFLVWRRWGKEPKAPVDVGDYWREPLDDPPAVTVTNLHFGSVATAAFPGTVVDLAQRGHLTISEDHDEHRTVYHFTATDAPKDPLLPNEQFLLENLFRGQPTTTSEDLKRWARLNHSEAEAFWQAWQHSVKREVTKRGYLERGRAAPWIWWLVIAGVVGVGGIVALSLGAWLGLVAIGVAIGVLAFGSTLRRRTPKGAQQAAEAEALRRFLKDFSTLDEAPVESLAIWERYLVAAVALGVAGDLVRGMALKVPDVVSSPSFATWYAVDGAAGLVRLQAIDRFDTQFGAATVHAMTPSNTSGAGGGFSGGGGGGGGGGGFGAR